MTNTVKKPPTGIYETSAVLYSGNKNDPVQELSLIQAIQLGTGVRLTVLAKDTQTGEMVKLENILYKRPENKPVAVSPGMKFVLRVPSYDAFIKKNTGVMEIVDIPSEPVVQNKSIPQQAQKDPADNFSTRQSAICRKFNAANEQVKKAMGLTIDRDDVVIMQGKENGRSPGFLVHQRDGNVYMFDKSGKQHVSLDPTKVRIQTAEIDSGGADEAYDSIAGLPVKRNKINDTVPQGTILTPQPRFIPNFAKLANLILFACDMIDLVATCATAVATLSDTNSSNNDDWKKREKEETFQKVVEGGTPNNV